MRHYFQSYLDRYPKQGTLRCSCGGEHALGTKKILLGDGVLEEMPSVFREHYRKDVKIWILSDQNTEKAAAEQCKRILSRFRFSSTVLPAVPRPRTSAEIIGCLCRIAGEYRPDLVLAVGGGTISDIAKMVSLNLAVPNWCVLTAPSVDAYSSGTAALKLKHRHKTEPAQPTEVIFADLGVLEQAPEVLFLSGVGDLLAKYLSFMDWKISALITEEHICEDTARMCLDSARQAMNAVKSLSSARRAAVQSLTDALLLSGLAMQALVSSRPASSAEHTIAHFWELAHTVGNPDLELHGLLVGLSCSILLAGYGEFYKNLRNWEYDLDNRLRILSAEPSWEQTLIPAVEPFREQMRDEMGEHLPGTEVYRTRLENIQKHRGTIIGLSDSLLRELQEAVEALSEISFPFSLSDYRLDVPQALLPMRYIRPLRNRYSSFNLIHEVGAEAQVLEILERRVQSIR
ncbi:MAG: iron-containing alcohol dehydrogenase [Spirochaetaceae bacterium]|nr:MAG: iron-containing alcohol dehydrogenase [Spirochaetaceae bacterium]